MFKSKYLEFYAVSNKSFEYLISEILKICSNNGYVFCSAVSRKKSINPDEFNHIIIVMCLKNSISIQPNITFHGEDINNIQVANLNDEVNCRRRAVSLRYIYLNSKINRYFEDTRNYNRLDQFVKHGCIDVNRLYNNRWRIMELSNDERKDISSYYNWENLAKLSEIVNIHKKKLYKVIPLLMWASVSKKMIKKRNYYKYNRKRKYKTEYICQPFPFDVAGLIFNYCTRNNDITGILYTENIIKIDGSYHSTLIENGRKAKGRNNYYKYCNII